MTAMTPLSQSNPTTDPLKEAERAHAELCAALRNAGVVLPSVRLDPMAYAEETPRPLIDLGRCNVPTARALTAALTSRNL